MENLGRCAAFAKLNLILRVEGRKRDGFHQLRMLNVPIDFSDEVALVRGGTAGDTIEISYADMIAGKFSPADRADLVDARKNSCLIAVSRFRERAGLDYSVHVSLTKSIPAAAGLGGGSSDAAAVLRILGASRDPGELMTIAASIGADVPFFLEPIAAEVTGVGERVRRIPDNPLRGREVLLIIPSFGCSTPAVYSAFKKLRPDLMEVSQSERSFLDTAEWIDGERLTEPFIAALTNELFEAAAAVQPDLVSILAACGRIPDSCPALTGSGSTFFVLPKSRHRFTPEQREAAARAAAEFGCAIAGCKIL